jgi:hypothetical protein
MKRIVAGLLLLLVGAATQSLAATPFDEFARGLSAATLPLFDGSGETTLSGTWRSLTSDTRKELRQDHEFLTGTYTNDANSVKYDLALQGDGRYRGRVRAALMMHWHRGPSRTWQRALCTFESKIVLRAVTPNRIEGRVYDYESLQSDQGGATEPAMACMEYDPLKWMDFVWVRAD